MLNGADLYKTKIEKLKENQATICVVGLGYVGLPLAISFAKEKLNVIGFDIDKKKVECLNNGIDIMEIIDKEDLNVLLNKNTLCFTTNPTAIQDADFVIIAVPTPVFKSKKPNLEYIKRAGKTVGKNLKHGCVVILESTVYPGVTEEVMMPILEETSRLKCGTDFKIGYSPERINPGDSEHTLNTIVKVVSGMDKETTDIIAELYKKVAKSGVFKAKDIKTADAAKVIENIQRDLNIALMNELALIFEKMDICIWDVLEAAATKWNFHRYYPGLVGGHCIPVDPYYLVYKAEELGYHPRVILSGRSINDYMPKHVVELVIKGFNDVEKVPKSSRVLLMGLTFKENVKDVRMSPTKQIIEELNEFGVEIIGYDPLLNAKEIKKEFGIKSVGYLEEIDGVDCIILTVVHNAFKEIRLDRLKRITNSNPLLIDVRGFFSPSEATEKGFMYKSL